MLQPQHTIVEVEAGRAVFEMAEYHRPDLIILDLEMEAGWSAREAVQQLKTLGLRVTVFTGHDEYRYVRDMLALAVDGYLLKTEKMSTVVVEIEEILSGTRRYSSKVAEIIASAHDEHTASVVVLQMLADGHTVNECARDMHVSERTIRTYIGAARERLHVRTSHAAVAKALRLGEIV